MPEFTHKKRGWLLIGVILYGRFETNHISQKELAQAKAVNIKLQNLSLNVAFGKTYAQTKPREAIALIGSHGFLEIALNQDSAVEKFNVAVGEKIEVMPA
jgi:S-adenosylmethionine hydrolase